jgi:hypothetical protein
VYKSQLLKDLGYTPKIKEHDFLVTKAINKQVHYYWQHQPQRVEQFKKEIDRYFKILDRLALNDRILRKFPRKGSILSDTIKDVFYMLLGLPVFIFGFVNNYLPYRLPGIITKVLALHAIIVAPYLCLLEHVTFLFFYGLQITLVQYFFHHICLRFVMQLLCPLQASLPGFMQSASTTCAAAG